MSKFWQKFLISQLFLIGVTINILAAGTKHDFSLLTVVNIIAPSLWYIGVVLQLPNGFGSTLRLAAPATVVGAALMMTSGICRLTGTSELLPLLAIALACILALPVLVSAILGFAVLRRKFSARNC